MDSQADLFNLRRVNHLFQKEATKRLTTVHHHIDFNTENHIEEFLDCMKNRESLKLIPIFPFSAFQVNLNLSRETLETFSTVLGPYIRRYLFRTSSVVCRPIDVIETGGKVVTLLSHSPGLTELREEMICNYEPCVTDKDLLLCPKALPSLRTLCISGSATSYSKRYPGNKCESLTEILLSRSAQLQSFKISTYHNTGTLGILKFLVQNRPNNLPYISLVSTVSLNSTSAFNYTFILELIGLKIILHEISFSIVPEKDSHAKTISRTVTKFLETYSKTLTKFHIRIEHNLSSWSLPLLPTLTTLTIDFPPRSYDLWPITSVLGGNTFLNLKKLRLENYRESDVMFETCSLPFVNTLELCRLGSPFVNPSWRRAFPNLKSLQISFDVQKEEFLYPTLSFILRHFTQLLDLDLGLSSYAINYGWCRWRSFVLPRWLKPITESNCNYWDLLSGGAPLKRVDLSSDPVLVKEFADPEQPVNGVYSLPSLRNMKGLL